MCPTLWSHGVQHARLPRLSPFLGVAQIHVHCIKDAIQPSHPLSPPFPPSLNLAQHQCLFQWIHLPIKWPNYWSFSFSIRPFNDYSGLISFRIDWFGLLAVQVTLKSLLQHHSLKASILWPSAFFMVQLSSPCILIITLNVNRLNEPAKRHRLAGKMKTCACMPFHLPHHSAWSPKPYVIILYH